MRPSDLATAPEARLLCAACLTGACAAGILMCEDAHRAAALLRQRAARSRQAGRVRCAVDWAFYGLEPYPDCGHPAEFEVSSGCVHEHCGTFPACGDCVDLMRSLETLPEWWCGRCASPPHWHVCPAPVSVSRLALSRAPR